MYVYKCISVYKYVHGMDVLGVELITAVGLETHRRPQVQVQITIFVHVCIQIISSTPSY